MAARLLLALLATTSLAAVAHADPIWHRATVTATSEKQPVSTRYAPWRAIDHDTRTGWCSGAKGSGNGQALTIAFDTPVTLTSFDIYARHGSGLQAVDVTLDGGTPRRVKLTSGIGTFAKAGTFKTMEVKIAAMRRGEACFDVGTFGVFVYAGDAAPFAKLEAATDALMAARATCDEAGFAAIATFPLGAPKRFRTAKALAAACKKKQLSPLQPEGWPHGNCGMVSADRVQCYGTGPDSFWDLVWKDDAWKLISISEKYYAE